MGLKLLIKEMKEASFTGKIYRLFEAYKKPVRAYENYLEFGSSYRFEDRSEGKEKLLYVMAGYEPYLWEPLFERVEKYVDEDIDVCILSSGIRKEKLAEIAEENNWSYISTEEGRIGPDQNIVIRNILKQTTYTNSMRTYS